jgi:hypothetical protein
MNNKIKSLLNQIRTIKKAYDLVAKNNGDNFNVFQILGLETAEVKTHSKFLAELLDPNGSHEQGNKFLKIFVKYINEFVIKDENIIRVNTKNSLVEVEKYIGEVTKDRGGRIDIAISEKNNFICIENKINAIEQKNQILRYYNYVKDNDYNFHILFLTLDGYKSQTINNDLIYLISYKKHIIEWLELCKKEAVDLPILREGIKQYINLIKKLTNQTTSKEMNDDIKKVLSNYLEEGQLISNSYNELVESLKQKEVSQLKEILSEQFQENRLQKSDREDGLLVVLKSYEKCELAIHIELDNNYFFFCLIKEGIRLKNQKNNPIKNELDFKIRILETKVYTIGIANDFTIGIDKNKYYYPEKDNSEKYLELTSILKEYYKKLND